ncbi:MAG: fatty acid CoA ligase family protein [Planctomycetaceae bacterium]
MSIASSSNIAERLRTAARQWPDRLAVVAPAGRNPDGSYRYREWTFQELDVESDRLAAGLQGMGVQPGMRLVLFVRFSWEFIALTFAVFKTGAVVVLIDPGMGRTNIFDCLKEVQPDGFIAIPIVHAVRLLKRRLFPKARFNVTVGRRWLWGGETYTSLREKPIPPPRASLADSTTSESPRAMPLEGHPSGTRPAAVIFTSGSTGAPKGVLYEHGMFDAQVDLIRDFYGIEPGEVDLPGFPLFGLFNAAMGVTTVIPDMDPTRPAQVSPENILAAIRDRQVTQAFGSPAFWNRVGRYCEQHNVTLPTIRRGLSAGGPVPNHVLRRMTRVLTGPGADLHTPYGATESLPVASIGGRRVLDRTAQLTAQGLGTCVGRPFPGVDVRIIEITAGPIASLAEARLLPPGEIGEIIVASPSVTREYYLRPDATRLAKIPLEQKAGLDEVRPTPQTGSEQQSRAVPFFHRMGDVGYLDAEGLLWFCGRKAHIVETPQGRMFSVCCEAIFDEHPQVYRSALVGVGTAPQQMPVLVVEPEAGQFPERDAEQSQMRSELLALGRANSLTAPIERILFHRSLPVDTRHNVKINREALGVWAASAMKWKDADVPATASQGLNKQLMRDADAGQPDPGT